jgi:hypothetical protein
MQSRRSETIEFLTTDELELLSSVIESKRD